jgi:hypothetical protein
LAFGINDKGQAVGFELIAPDVGFLFDGANFTKVYYPNSQGTTPLAINNIGQIVGAYQDSSGALHGFIAESPCGDNRDQLISEYGEYAQYGVSFVPACGQITHTAQSHYFTFSEINTPCSSQGTPDFSYAMVRQPLVAPASSGYGLDAWRVVFGGPRIITSGYRDPKQNTACGGATNSPHMFGHASDFNNNSYSTSCGPGTLCLKEYNAMVGAARIAHADWIEGTSMACGYKCTHADWRDHQGAYLP